MTETNQSSLADNDPVQVLNSLHNRRTTIEKVISVSIMLEKLHQNLQAMVLLGKSSSEISAKTRSTLTKLDEKVRILPTPRLQELTEKVDLLIKSKLKGILTLINQKNVDSILHKKSESMIQELQHRAQTAVALRVTLEERGTRTKPLSLGVAPELLRKKATILKQQESIQRDHLKSSLKSMQADIKVVLSNKAFPEKMLEVARKMKSGIEENLRHLKSDKSITKMPMAIELIDSGSIGENYDLPTEEELFQNEPPALEESQKATPESIDNSQEEPKEPKQGLINKFIEWLNTPWSRSWKDIKKDKKVSR